MRGEFVELIPHRRIVFTLGWEPADGAPPVAPGSTTVTITLAADNGGTMLTLRHSGLPPTARDMHRSGWSHYLPALASAAGRPDAHAQGGYSLGMQGSGAPAPPRSAPTSDSATATE
jgi:hypothetical protein